MKEVIKYFLTLRNKFLTVLKSLLRQLLIYDQ